jgi:hypothetical protein
MAKRVLAAVGAVALVLAALAVRSAWSSDDGDDPGGGDDGSLLQLVCDPDLADVCDELEGVAVQVRDSAEVSDVLVADELEAGAAWVTSSAWTELTASRLGTAGRSLGEVERLATSDVVVATIVTRAPVLAEACGDVALWRCLGDAAGRPWTEIGGLDAWGAVEVGLPDADTAAGLPVLASVAVGHFGGTDFAANDFTGFDGWLARLAEPSGTGDRDLLTTLVRVRGTYDAGGVLLHEAAPRIEVEALEAEPTVPAEVVLARLDGSALPADLADQLRRALAAEGWTEAAGEPAPLLGQGVMGALHALWKDVTR